MIRDELSRLLRYEERHRRLIARVAIASGASIVIFLVGTPLIWLTEHGQPGGAIHSLGDAAFFTAVQLLTISSSMPNPVTPAGEGIDVGLEMWAIFVVTALAGSLSTFFRSADTAPRD